MDHVRDKLMIGLTGSLGSGCTTLAEALETKGFERISISLLIKEKFKKLNGGKEPSLEGFGDDWRAELQDIGNRGRKGEFAEPRENGKDYRSYWVDMALKDFEDLNKDIVIDGLRNIGEVQALRRDYSQFWLVAVYADYGTRWTRIKQLNMYPNEKVFIRDNERDSGEDDRFGQNVQLCVLEADYVINNDERIDPPSQIGRKLGKRLERPFDGFRSVGSMNGQELLKPLPAEVFMATAVSQSHASQCIKRRVGALVVDETNKIPLSVGYNDNPIGMESCFSLYDNYCFKDKVMETKLENMAPFFCPECGTKHKTIEPPWRCNTKKGNGAQCRCNFKLKFFPSRCMEVCTAIHAEERAIRSLGYRNAEGCTLYVNTFPCLLCCRYIKDTQITKVVYVEAYPVVEAIEFLKINKINIEAFEGFTPRVFNQVFRQVH